MTSQAWVLFKHYVMYTEQELSGSSRQLSYDDLMTLAHMPASARWTRFLNHNNVTAPIVDWAVANGVLAKGETYTAIETNEAIKALNEQRERLKNALETFFSVHFCFTRQRFKTCNGSTRNRQSCKHPSWNRRRIQSSTPWLNCTWQVS